MLPNGSEVLQHLLTLKAENQGRYANNERECAIALCLQWIYCNVYPISIMCTQCKRHKMLECYRSLKKFTSKTDTYWKKYELFIQTQSDLFDIRSDHERTMAKLWGVKMTSDMQFHEIQKKKKKQIGYCTNFTERKWQLSVARK